MAEECDHTVGWDRVADDEGDTPVSVSSLQLLGGPLSRPSIEFNFCPDCGASLEEFWKPIRYPSG